MEQGESISFSSVVAGLLLCKRNITSVEIVNFLSKLSCEGMDISDIDDDVDDLLICVHMDDCYSFSLRDGLFYDTVLYRDITVHKFLKGYVDPRVLDMIQKDSDYGIEYQKNCPKEVYEETILPFYLSWKKDEPKKKSTKLERIRKPLKRNSWYSFLGGVR